MPAEASNLAPPAPRVERLGQPAPQGRSVTRTGGDAAAAVAPGRYYQCHDREEPMSDTERDAHRQELRDALFTRLIDADDLIWLEERLQQPTTIEM